MKKIISIAVFAILIGGHIMSSDYDFSLKKEKQEQGGRTISMALAEHNAKNPSSSERIARAEAYIKSNMHNPKSYKRDSYTENYNGTITIYYYGQNGFGATVKESYTY